MNWAQEQRQTYIFECLKTRGRINRADLVREFRISVAAAALDFRRFHALHPGAMAYDVRQKTYLAVAELGGCGAAS